MIRADLAASKAHIISTVNEYVDYVMRGGEVRPVEDSV